MRRTKGPPPKAYARPGMRVRDANSGECGEIIEMDKLAAIVQMSGHADACQSVRGRTIAIRWEELELIDVQPDPGPWRRSTELAMPQAPFADIEEETIDGDGISLRFPPDAAPASARPGMVAYLTDAPAPYGVIEITTPEFCSVRLENGQAVALRWGQVLLTNVWADPIYIGHYYAYEKTTASAPTDQSKGSEAVAAETTE